MAFGKLGWKPDEYYRSSPYEFFCACEGYFDKKDSEAMMHRANATIIYRALGGTDNIERAWPIGNYNKEPQELTEMLTQEEAMEIFKAHKVK
jgi:hypothetical protein